MQIPLGFQSAEGNGSTGGHAEAVVNRMHQISMPRRRELRPAGDDPG
jgi:hypothetical protein